MQKRYLILILCIITLMSIQFVSANDNTDNITVLANSGDVELLQAPSETKTYTDLKNLIDTDTSGEISLDYNYKWDGSDWQNPDPKTGINITKNLVINGNGATINGADVSSLFNISSGVTVTLKNLTITNAGGIYHDYSTGSHVVTAYHAIISEGTINIVDCIFKNSNLNDYSNPNINGSIYSTGNINIQNSKFIDNNVATYGVIYTSGTVTVSNSSFSNNKAQKGGAIYSKDKVIINNSTFDKNGGDSNLIGGAIYADSDVTIINSNFTENGNTKTGSQGGAIYTNGGIGLIENCIFTKNKAQEGGSIFINSSDCTTTIKNSNFMGDSQTTLTNGGAILY